MLADGVPPNNGLQRTSTSLSLGTRRWSRGTLGGPTVTGLEPNPAFAGIDVACAKRKPLPVSVSVWGEGALIPLPLRTAATKPPRGAGNIGALDEQAAAELANSTARYLREIETEFNVAIVRIAIDAPSNPKANDTTRRLSELALDNRKISCTTTRSAREFDDIKHAR